MTLYAVGLAHANDNATSSDFVGIGSAMLITLGLCSAIGAPLASLMMNIIGAAGLYAFTSLCLFLFFVFVTTRRRQHKSPISEENHEDFRTITEMAGPTIYEIDPRSDENNHHNKEHA